MNGHRFLPVSGLIQICKDCGYNLTLVATLTNAVKPCPAALARLQAKLQDHFKKLTENDW